MEAATLTVDDVMRALLKCNDPEIPVNIVDLGLIYDVKISGSEVNVKMTMTSRGCPAHDFLSKQVKDEVLKLPRVKNANVEVVWEPPWTQERMSAAAKEKVGARKQGLIRIGIEIKKPLKKGKLITRQDGTLVLMSDNGDAYEVSEDEANIWSICDATRTFDDLVGILSEKKGVEGNSLRKQLIETLADFRDSGLIIGSPEDDVNKNDKSKFKIIT